MRRLTQFVENHRSITSNQLSFLTYSKASIIIIIIIIIIPGTHYNSTIRYTLLLLQLVVFVSFLLSCSIEGGAAVLALDIATDGSIGRRRQRVCQSSRIGFAAETGIHVTITRYHRFVE